MGKKKVRCRVGGWEVEAVPGTAYTFGDGSRYWGPRPVAEVPKGEEYYFSGLEYAIPIEPEAQQEQ